MFFGEMYDEMHLKLSTKEEDGIPHHFFSDEFRWA